MKFFQSLRRKPEFVPDPRLEEMVNRINEFITKHWVVAQTNWTPEPAYSSDVLVEFAIIRKEIDSIVTIGGEELREYLLPWKGLKGQGFEHHDRIRVANYIVKD